MRRTIALSSQKATKQSARNWLPSWSGSAWWRPDWAVVTVEDGVVQFRGVIDTQEEKRAARVAAENVSGVRKVEDLRQRYADVTSGF